MIIRLFVLLPKEITLLSNNISVGEQVNAVLLPKEITLLSNLGILDYAKSVGFTTKRNYTTLKLRPHRIDFRVRFTTKRNYTTLKLYNRPKERRACFTTKRNYTTLKHFRARDRKLSSFTTKRNYTTLKPQIHEAKSTMLLPNRVISVDISAKTA